MISKWIATVINPLGEEKYNVNLDSMGDVAIATISNQRGTVQFTQIENLSSIFLADIETPMRTKLELEFSTNDFTGENMTAILRVGEFSIMKVNLVRYE